MHNRLNIHDKEYRLFTWINKEDYDEFQLKQDSRLYPKDKLNMNDEDKHIVDLYNSCNVSSSTNLFCTLGYSHNEKIYSHEEYIKIMFEYSNSLYGKHELMTFDAKKLLIELEIPHKLHLDKLVLDFIAYMYKDNHMVNTYSNLIAVFIPYINRDWIINIFSLSEILHEAMYSELYSKQCKDFIYKEIDKELKKYNYHYSVTGKEGYKNGNICGTNPRPIDAEVKVKKIL